MRGGLLDEAAQVKYGSVDILQVFYGRDEVWPKTPVNITGNSTQWDTINLTITPPSIGADTYTVKRGSTTIYDGPLTSKSDSGAPLEPETSYGYTVEAYKGTILVSQNSVTISTATRAAPVVTASTPGWDQIDLTWTDAAPGSIDEYRVYRDNIQVKDKISPPTMSWNDTGRLPEQKHEYEVRSYRDGTEILPRSVAESYTSAKRTAPVLTATALSHNVISLRWTDADQRSVDWYKIFEGARELDSGSDKAHDTGVPDQGNHTFTLKSYRGGSAGTEIPPVASKTANTSAFPWPVDNHIITLPDEIVTSGGTYSCSALSMTGRTFTNTWVYGWVQSVNFRCWAATKTKDGHIRPTINGVYQGDKYPPRPPFGVNPAPAWYTVAVSGVNVSPGNITTSTILAGNCDYSTGWQTWRGQGSNWDKTINTNTMVLAYYRGRETEAAMRQQPWWNESLIGRPLDTHEWCDLNGETEKVVVRDKSTRAVLLEWERPS